MRYHHSACPCDTCHASTEEWDYMAEQTCGGCGAPRYVWSADTEGWGWNPCGCDWVTRQTTLEDATERVTYTPRDLDQEDDSTWFV